MEKIAIIGTGIAGMTAAWYLRELYDIHFFDKNDYAGGHTNTVMVNEGDKAVPIDTGFMVFNDYTYPNLIRFFEELGVRGTETNMSFSVENRATDFVFSSNGFSGFFANRANVFSPKHWKLIRHIQKYFKEANEYIQSAVDDGLSISDFVRARNLSQEVANNFIYPMASAIWSTHSASIEDYPAKSMLQFMSNHGLLGFDTQFKWKTIAGGSRIYRDIVLGHFEGKIHLNDGIQSVKENLGHTVITTKSGERHEFDYVIVATHADEALAILDRPTAEQTRLLSPFKYNINQAVLHSDPLVMPRYEPAWASWNYSSYQSNGSKNKASTHYWMNQLQPLDTKTNYFVSIDSEQPIHPEHVQWSATYHHPCFNGETLKAQKELPLLNQQSRIKFCGSYFNNGFHEDAHVAGLQVANQLKEKKGVQHEILSL